MTRPADRSLPSRLSPDAFIRTSRLLLRPWRDTDLVPFAAMNADPEVMLYLPAPLDREASDAFVARARDHFVRNGFGLWAVELPGVADFIGFIGLSIPSFTAPFTPCVEVGWRLAREHWGQGYASEGARAALDVGFGLMDLDEIVSFTVPANQRSRAVMERLGMTHDSADDFDHPSLPPDHLLSRHVLYRIARARWRDRGARRE